MLVHIPRLLLPALLAALACSTLAAQTRETITISERVGATIDSLEIAYFSLFTRSGTVVEARAQRQGEGAVVLLERSGDADTTIVLSAAQIASMRRHIEELERRLAGEVPAENDVSALYRLDNRIGFDDDVRIELLDGRIIEGVLLHADRRGIVVMPIDDAYDWRRLRLDAVTIAPHEIDRIIESGPIPVGMATGVATAGAAVSFAYVNDRRRPAVVPMSLGVAFGGLLGAVATSALSTDHAIEGNAATYEAELPNINSLRHFADVSPPEVRLAVDSALAAVRAPASPTPAYSFDEHARRRFAIAALMSTHATDATHPYVGTIIDSWPADAGASVPILGVAVETTYDLTPRLGVGAVIEYGMPSSDDQSDGEVITELSGIGIVDFNLTPRRALGRQAMEIVVGAGAGAARLDLEARVALAPRSAFQQGTMMTVVPMAMVRTQMRYNFSEAMAIQAGMQARWYGGLTVPSYGYEAPTTRERLRTVEEHEIRIVGLYAQIGLRISI